MTSQVMEETIGNVFPASDGEITLFLHKIIVFFFFLDHFVSRVALPTNYADASF